MKYLRTISLYSVMTVFGLFALLPFVWLVSTSFKGAEELFSFPPVLWPKKFVLQNYTGVWNAVPFLAYTLNSIIIAAASVVLNVTLASLAGFALARYRFKGRNLIFLFVVPAARNARPSPLSWSRINPNSAGNPRESKGRRS